MEIVARRPLRFDLSARVQVEVTMRFLSTACGSLLTGSSKAESLQFPAQSRWRRKFAWY